MTLVEYISRLEHKIRPVWSKLPPELAIKVFSNGRKVFLKAFTHDLPVERIYLPESRRIKLWDIQFSNNIFNAAGLFKKGEGYYTCVAQGAGAYLAGTTTAVPRKGNIKNGIKHPVATFTKSGTAINWMGLPNYGHEFVAKRLSRLEKAKNCPIGISLASAPEHKDIEALNGILEGFEIFDRAGVDFIELNESCPNVIHEHSHETVNGLDKALVDRLEYISVNFLKKRNRNLPVIVKFSNDTEPAQLPELIKILTEMNFDGVNFGNTSTDYADYLGNMHYTELNIYKHFYSNFGGGVSGRVLKERSLALASSAVMLSNKLNLKNEFHVIRTGGIESAEDIMQSDKFGISLNQWFTGYFDAFAHSGHSVYLKMTEEK